MFFWKREGSFNCAASIINLVENLIDGKTDSDPKICNTDPVILYN